jgi:hypothetical protein
MFRLPLPTWKLVMGPVVAGLLVLGFFYGVWVCSLAWLFHWRLGSQWMATIAAHYLTLAAMLVSLQAIVWSLHRHPWIRLPALLVILVGLTVASLQASVVKSR